MISVIASVRVKPGKLSELLEIFKANVITVREEKGCIEYFLAVDGGVTGLPQQQLDENVVTIIEKWESLEVLRQHATAPYMHAFQEKVKDLMEDMSFKVLREA